MSTTESQIVSLSHVSVMKPISTLLLKINSRTSSNFGTRDMVLESIIQGTKLDKFFFKGLDCTETGIKLLIFRVLASSRKGILRDVTRTGILLFGLKLLSTLLIGSTPGSRHNMRGGKDASGEFPALLLAVV